MEGFVLQHTTKGTYVSRPNSASSYTSHINNIRVYANRDSAMRDMCRESEVIRRLDEVIGMGL